MNTAVDSSIVLDLLIPNTIWFAPAQAAVALAAGDGEVIICEAVLAEVAAHFRPGDGPEDFLAQIGLTYVASSPQSLLRAGRSWATYARSRPAGLVCGACGAETRAQCHQCEAAITIRQRVLPDFMVGAHALEHADRLLTRDKGIYRRYFPDLDLI